MREWVTQILAVNPQTGMLCSYGGPLVPGRTQAEAETYLQENGLGYCHIVGLHIKTIPFKGADTGKLYYAPFRDN